MSSLDHHGARTHLDESFRGGPELLVAIDENSGESFGFVDVRRNYSRQRDGDLAKARSPPQPYRAPELDMITGSITGAVRLICPNGSSDYRRPHAQRSNLNGIGKCSRHTISICFAIIAGATRSLRRTVELF